jgi:hypothetical protein
MVTDDEVIADVEASMYTYWQPLTEAADAAIEYAQHPERRVYMGIRALDDAMRGTAPKQMTEVIGYTHNGKTLLTTHMVLSNPDKVGVWATPDESRLTVLSKLAAATSGYGWETIEMWLQSRDRDLEKRARALLYETAERFHNLSVIECAMNGITLSAAVSETEQALSRNVDYVIYDFAKLWNIEGDETAKLNDIKWWCATTGKPIFVLHQTSRTTGRDGEPITIDSGRFGGEDVATFMIGVRRQANWYKALIKDAEREYEKEKAHAKRIEIQGAIDEYRSKLAEHINTITINLVKNKVPPARLVPDFDMDIDWQTGTLLPRGAAPKPVSQPLVQSAFGGMP